MPCRTLAANVSSMFRLRCVGARRALAVVVRGADDRRDPQHQERAVEDRADVLGRIAPRRRSFVAFTLSGEV